jgi:hypothetical protein
MYQIRVFGEIHSYEKLVALWGDLFHHRVNTLNPLGKIGGRQSAFTPGVNFIPGKFVV